jgi:hypothetical protein
MTKPRTYRPAMLISADLHNEAKCGDCSRTWPPSSNTLTLVKAHIKTTGHNVLVERRTVSEYGPA